jgi:hypothetical protein
MPNPDDYAQNASAVMHPELSLTRMPGCMCRGGAGRPGRPAGLVSAGLRWRVDDVGCLP